MKQLAMSTTKNVVNGQKMIQYLLNRPKTEMVGLGLLYGQPGLGKSRFAKQQAIMNDYVYLRLEATMTAKSFSVRLLEVLRYHLGITKTPIWGSTNEIFNKILDILRHYDNLVIIIDEIDYAFDRKRILGSIRDIVDETLSVIILVGMSDAREKLLMADAHYFDRCNYFCEFQEVTEEDIRLLCQEVPDVRIDDKIVKFLKKVTKGNLRKLMKALYSIETTSKAYNISEFTVEQLKLIEIS